MFLLILTWIGFILIPGIILIICVVTGLRDGEVGIVRLVVIGVCALGTIGLIIGAIVNTNEFSRRTYVNTINTYLDYLRKDDGPVNKDSIVNYTVSLKNSKIMVSLIGSSSDKYSGEEVFGATYTRYNPNHEQYIEYQATFKNQDLQAEKGAEILSFYKIAYSTYYTEQEAKDIGSKECRKALDSAAETLIRLGHQCYYTKSSSHQSWDKKFEPRDFNLFHYFDSKFLKDVYGEYKVA